MNEIRKKKTVSISLDSITRSPGASGYSWYISVPGGMSSLLNGSSKIYKMPTNIKKMRIHSFFIPPPISNYNLVNTIRINIMQVAKNSYIISKPEIFDYNFEFKARYDNSINKYHLIPISDTIDFEPLLSEITEITFLFYDPFRPYVLPKDYSTAEISINAQQQTTLTFEEEPTLNSGDLIIIINLTVTSVLQPPDDYVKDVTNSMGVPVIKMSPLNYLILNIPWTIVGVFTGTVNIYLNSLRFSVPIEFEYEEQSF